jgi:alpha-beta hydrolase superfamily lysophospholipase
VSSPLRRTEDHFAAAGGRTLFYRSWQPPQPERAVVLVHGFGEHCGRYEELASWLSHRGCVVYAYDHQGHGQSPGSRGHADRFEDFQDDLEAFLSLVRAAHPDLSLVLVGHSMGGLVVASLATDRDPRIDLLVTSGALLAMSPNISKMKRLLAKGLRRIAPRLSMEAGLDLEGLASDPEVARRYVADPLVHGRVTAAMAAGMMDATVATAGRAGNVRIPMLLLHGEEDPLCLPAGSIAFHEALPHSEVAGSAIRTYSKLRHEVFNEPERERIYQHLLDWVLGHERERAAAKGGGSEGGG